MKKNKIKGEEIYIEDFDDIYYFGKNDIEWILDELSTKDDYDISLSIEKLPSKFALHVFYKNYVTLEIVDHKKIVELIEADMIKYLLDIQEETKCYLEWPSCLKTKQDTSGGADSRKRN